MSSPTEIDKTERMLVPSYSNLSTGGPSLACGPCGFSLFLLPRRPEPSANARRASESGRRVQDPIYGLGAVAWPETRETAPAIGGRGTLAKRKIPRLAWQLEGPKVAIGGAQGLFFPQKVKGIFIRGLLPWEKHAALGKKCLHASGSSPRIRCHT